MKKILLPFLAAGICASASAITVDQLTQMRAAVVFQGHDMQLSFPVAASGGYFTKENNNTVHLHNFYDGLGRKFKLDSQGNLTLQLYDGFSGPIDYYGNGTEMYGVFSMCREVQATYNYDGESALLLCWQYGMLDEEIPSTQHAVVEAGKLEGWGFNHRGNGGQGPAILLEWMDKSAFLYDIACFNGFTMYAFTTNGEAEDISNGFMADAYGVDIEIADKPNSEGTYDVTVKNFLNLGMSYAVDPQKLSYGVNFVYGTLDKTTGEVLFPIQEIAGEVDFGFIGDGSDYDSFLGDDQLFADGPKGYWLMYLGTDYYPWLLIDSSTIGKDSDGDTTAAPITGYYSIGNAKHVGTTRWVSNDGDCKTNAETRIEIGSAGIYASAYDAVIAAVDGSVMSIPSEYTADATLDVIYATFWGNNGTFMGRISDETNSDNIESYDVYAVEGSYSSIYDGGFRNDNTLGHKDAFLVYEGAQKGQTIRTEYNRASSSENDGDKMFTYFLKANYKPETGLESSFHSMVPYSTENGVGDINQEVAFVSAANGVITIAGTDAEATVYNAAGVTVYQGLDREIPVTSGVYMVRVAGKVTKVVL